MEIYYVSKQDNKRKYVYGFTPKIITTRCEMLRALGYNIHEKNASLAVMGIGTDDNSYPIEEFKASCRFNKILSIILIIIWLFSSPNEVAFCSNGLVVLVSAYFLQKEERRVKHFNNSNLSHH